jgi:hypothetical protein
MTPKLFPSVMAALAMAGAFVGAANCGGGDAGFSGPTTTTTTGGMGGSGGKGTGGMGGMGGSGGQSCDVNACPGEDTTCSKRACDGDKCVRVNAAQETKCTEDGGKLCDGEGACVECLKKDDCAGTDICQAKACVPATCMNAKKDNDESDVDCGGGQCNPCDLMKGCLEANDCKSGFCVKQDQNAPGTCTACAKDADCLESPGTFCKGGTCTKKKDNGDACLGANECGSGFCPKQDGVCCDKACDGSCVSCLTVKTGGAIGTCSSVKASTDPDKECGDAGAATCGANNTGCNGAADKPACNVYPADAQCAAAVCKNGKAIPALSCDGKGMCVPQQGTSCAPYTCDAAGAACLKTCTKDSECDGEHWCDLNAKTCQAKKNKGDGCTGNSQCASGFCPTQDGVCCDKSCGSTCEACLLSKTGLPNGTCGNILALKDPDAECAGATQCCSQGSCVTSLGCN